jgi:hypothetical protein
MPSQLELSDQECGAGIRPHANGLKKSERRFSTVRGLSHAWIVIDQNGGMARLAI